MTAPLSHFCLKLLHRQAGRDRLVQVLGQGDFAILARRSSRLAVFVVLDGVSRLVAWHLSASGATKAPNDHAPSVVFAILSVGASFLELPGRPPANHLLSGLGAC